MLKDMEWEPSIPSMETCEKIWLQTDCGKIDAKFSEAENQKLDSGMYIRVAILIGKEMADLKPLTEKIEAIENVKCAIRRNDRLLYVLLFVADCLTQQDIADMSKYDVWHKHDKTAKRTVMAFQEQLNEIIREFDIHSYQAYYATTNFGSFSTRAAGNLLYEPGNDDIDQRFFACPHESFENEVDRDLNGVKGYRRIYPIVTATD